MVTHAKNKELFKKAEELREQDKRAMYSNIRNITRDNSITPKQTPPPKRQG
jgi:hypothetical protein